VLPGRRVRHLSSPPSISPGVAKPVVQEFSFGVNADFWKLGKKILGKGSKNNKKSDIK
jgi:hypothetical protein